MRNLILPCKFGRDLGMKRWRKKWGHNTVPVKLSRTTECYVFRIHLMVLNGRGSRKPPFNKFTAWNSQLYGSIWLTLIRRPMQKIVQTAGISANQWSSCGISSRSHMGTNNNAGFGFKKNHKIHRMSIINRINVHSKNWMRFLERETHWISVESNGASDVERYYLLIGTHIIHSDNNLYGLRHDASVLPLLLPSNNLLRIMTFQFPNLWSYLIPL